VTLLGHTAAEGAATGERLLRGASIGAAALAVPDQVVPNSVVAERLGVDARWIEKRTGVVERRIATPEDSVASLAASAARRTLELADCAPEAVDLVLVATCRPDHITPTVAPQVVDLAGLGSAGAFDLGSACSGWLAGVRVAAGQVETGRADNVLVIGSDVMSRVTDPYDRSTAVVFADGAGAVLVSGCDGRSRIGPVVLGTDPGGAELIYARHDEGVVRMQGAATFGAAVEHLGAATRDAVAAAGLTLEDIDLFAYHQANRRIITAVGDRLSLDDERVLVSVDHYANTSAATIPMVLAEAAENGRLNEGALVLLATFGAGFTYGAAVVEWGMQ
jgi:3-oxoacyl-[acyl-carrier-protein] synthase III